MMTATMMTYGRFTLNRLSIRGLLLGYALRMSHKISMSTYNCTIVPRQSASLMRTQVF